MAPSPVQIYRQRYGQYHRKSIQDAISHRNSNRTSWRALAACYKVPVSTLRDAYALQYPQGQTAAPAQQQNPAADPIDGDEDPAVAVSANGAHVEPDDSAPPAQQQEHQQQQ